MKKTSLEDGRELSGSLGKDESQLVQTENQENPHEHKETGFHWESGQTPE